MQDWFTVEMIDADTYAISEYVHWEEPHCYLICGAAYALLIDTGLGVADVRSVVNSLTALPVLAALAHAHWDHIGGCAAFEAVAVHEVERDWISGRFPLPPEMVKRNLTCRPCVFPETFRPADYRIFSGGPQHLLHDGDGLDLGGRKLSVVHTPGHSPGHCCFYEEERGYLFSGDLLYVGKLDAFYPTTDPRQFWRSVQKVRKLEFSRILPGHHTLDIPTGFADAVERAFSELEEQGMLEQGNGIFDFGAFRLHI